MKSLMIALTVALFGLTSADAAEYLEKSDMQKARAFSPAVVAEGGRTVYLAGQTTLADENGANIAGNFEAQTRTIFKSMEDACTGAAKAHSRDMRRARELLTKYFA